MTGSKAHSWRLCQDDIRVQQTPKARRGRGRAREARPWLLTFGCGRRRTAPAGRAAPRRSAPRRARGRCAGCAGCAGARGARAAARAAPPGSSPGGCGSRWTGPSGRCPTLEGSGEGGLTGPGTSRPSPSPLHLLPLRARTPRAGSPVPM